MGKIKELFTDIQLALESGNYVELITVLERLPEDDRAQWLLDTVETLAAWQREEGN